MIQIINSYNLLTEKAAENDPWTVYKPDKKCEKSIGELEMNFPKRKKLKPSNRPDLHNLQTRKHTFKYDYFPSFLFCLKNA